MSAFSQPKVMMMLGLNSAGLKQGFDKAKALTGKFVSDVNTKLKQIKLGGGGSSSPGEGMFDRVRGMLGGGFDMGGMLSGMSGKLGMLAAGIGLVTALGVKATTMSMDWERSMAKVNVTTQLQKDELKGLSDEILHIAGRNANPFEEVPQAFNKIVSSGMDMNSALKMLEPTLKAAKAGFADVETVASAAVSIMASSGIDNATRVYDILFATLNKGNAEFADISQYLPKIIPGARNAGIALEDVAGAYAYLTAQGFKAEAAATGLQNVFKAFSDGRTIKGFDTIGVKLFDAEGRARGLNPVLQDLQKSLLGLTDQQRITKLDKIGLDQEASMALSSMLQDYDKLQGILGYVRNSQGELNKAIDAGANSTDNWKIAMNGLSASVTELGNELKPVAELLAYSAQFGVDAAGGIINLWRNQIRWLKGDMSVEEERNFNYNKKLRNDKQREYMPFMQDNRINDFVRRDAVDWFNKDRTINPEGLLDYEMEHAKLLHGYKKIIDRGLDSNDGKVKSLLKSYGVGNTEDFYKLMESGKLPEASSKIESLLPKTPANGKAIHTSTTGAGTKAKGDGGVSEVINGSKKEKVTNIHIENFIKGDLISQAAAIKGMSKEELLNFMREAFRRMVVDMENGVA
ncbi:phage tail tape measure protein [Chitinophagaceae bacterium IBVUCB1]|nr:phage tail tape measure protein [Chitinophagaceae bacterium IBVUCB1]